MILFFDQTTIMSDLGSAGLDLGSADSDLGSADSDLGPSVPGVG